MAQQTQQSWEQRLARLDRRWVYAGLFLFTLIPLLLKVPSPVYITPPAREFHETVEEVLTGQPDKIVLVSSAWDAGTSAENEPQSVALFRHLLRRKAKFVILGLSPNSPQMMQNALSLAIQQEFRGRPGAGQYPVVGTDFVNVGYKLRNTPWIRTLTQNPTEAFQTDWKGTPVKNLPLFQTIMAKPDKSLAGSFSLLVDITASATIDAWISLVRPTGVQVMLGCTAVMAPEQYPFLATRQLSGMLTGMRGAAEYESLLGNRDGRARLMMAGQSFAHLYIFLLIGVGNLAIVRAWFARRRRG